MFRAVRMGMALNKLLQEHGKDFVTSITLENGNFVLRLRPPNEGEAGGFTQTLQDFDSLQHEGGCRRLANWLAGHYGWNANQTTLFCEALVQFAVQAQEGAVLICRDNRITRQ